MTTKYPPPVVRKRIEPGSVPLRSWVCKSYDPVSGRQAQVDGGGNHGTVSAQMPRGNWHEIDARRCQNPQPVKTRPLG